MRSLDPCSSHTPHGAVHTHVSDHRGPPRSSLDLPDPKPAALPLAHRISTGLFTAILTRGRRHGQRSEPALRSDLDYAARSNFLCVPSTTTSLPEWASNLDGLVRAAGDQLRMQPLRLPDTRLEAILTSST